MSNEVFLSIALGIVVGFLVGIILSYELTEDKWEKLTIAKGYASYVVAEDGDVEFKWK